jgi:hypothetical protein
MWEVVDRYLDQDRVAPVPDGTEIELEQMTAAHRLCLLLALETPYPGTKLVRRLRELVSS